ncbi:hypothetical protein OIU79_003123, partial [Salix purpurea]
MLAISPILVALSGPLIS